MPQLNLNRVWFMVAIAWGTGSLVAEEPTFPVHPRETTEWINYCAYNAAKTKLPRVLLIGDSICNGYQGAVRTELAGTAEVTYLATSKCLCDSTYLKLLDFVLGESSYDIIHFNNGLHSLHSDTAHWAFQLRATIRLMKQRASGAKLIWATSTPLKDPALTAKALELNAIAARIMAEEGIPTDDLFARMNPLDRATYWRDTFHFTNPAIDMQAKTIADSIRAALGKSKATTAEAAASLKSAATATGPDGALK